MASTTDQIVLQYVTRGEGQLQGSLRSVGGAVDRLERRFDLLAQAAGALGGRRVVGALFSMGRASLAASADMEKSRVALTHLVGDSASARREIKRLSEFTAQTPFSSGEILQASQRLRQLGYTAQELIPTMRSLSTAVYLSGGGAGDFDRLIVRLGRIRAEGKATAGTLTAFARRGINLAEVIGAGLGEEFTQEQLTELDGERFIAGFVKGMERLYGEASQEIARSTQVNLKNMAEAWDGVKIAAGDAISPEATRILKGITAQLDKMSAFAEKHPALLKTLLWGTGGAGAVAGSALTMSSLVGAYGNLRDVIGGVIAKKRGLERATRLDTAAEAAKTVVAGKEGAAIGKVGAAAREAAKSKGLLATVTKTAGGYSELVAAETARLAKELKVTTPGGLKTIRTHVMDRLASQGVTEASFNAAVRAQRQAAAQAAHLARYSRPESVFTRIRGALNRPVRPTASTVPVTDAIRNRYQFLGMGNGMPNSMGVWRDTTTGRYASYEDVFNYRRAIAGGGGPRGINTLSAFGRGGNALTYGGVAMGGLAGVGAGAAAYGNWKAMGDSTGTAIAKASVTGITAGLGAMFVPGGAVAVAVGEALAWGINKYINEPMEKAALGRSAEETAELAAKSREEQAKFYDEEAARLEARSAASRRQKSTKFDTMVTYGSTIEEDEAQAASFRLQAQSQRRRAKDEARAEQEAQAAQEKAARQQRQEWERRINNPGASFNQGPQSRGPQASQSRSGGWTVRFPASPADASDRNMKFALNTPAPAYL